MKKSHKYAISTSTITHFGAAYRISGKLANRTRRQPLYYKFSREFASEKKLKIGQYLARR